MNIKTLFLLPVLTIVMLSLCSCHVKISNSTSKSESQDSSFLAPLGNYSIMSYGLTDKAAAENITFQGPHPVFTFRKDGTVRIFPDFSFGYFKDSVYTYTCTDKELKLVGKTVTLNIPITEYKPASRESYRLKPDSKYLREIFIINR